MQFQISSGRESRCRDNLECSRLQFLEKILANNFALLDVEVLSISAITQEPDFSQTCGFRRKVRKPLVFSYSSKKVHMNGSDFC